jgi:hypothetical protein
VLAASRRSLAPGGRLVISVVHPVLTAPVEVEPTGPRTTWLVDDYFVPGGGAATVRRPAGLKKPAGQSR